MTGVWAERCRVPDGDGECGVRLRVDGHCTVHGVVPGAACRAEVDTGLWDERLGGCYATHVDINRDHVGDWPVIVTYKGLAFRESSRQFETGPRRYERADGQRESRPASSAAAATTQATLW